MARFEIVPVPKPRMTQSDKWKQRPVVLHYWQYKDELQRQAKEWDFELGPAFRVSFYLPMPKSWSKKKKAEMQGRPHQTTPDLDNLEKALTDSLLPQNDAGVWCKISQKLWDYNGSIIIGNLEDFQ